MSKAASYELRAASEKQVLRFAQDDNFIQDENFWRDDKVWRATGLSDGGSLRTDN